MDTEKFQSSSLLREIPFGHRSSARCLLRSFNQADTNHNRSWGKSWRSYATVACSDIVGGNAQLAKDWLALPELMHVGSLMVDDVQDKSALRRGGPAAHHMFGEAIAINSGSAAYFLGQICVYIADIDPELKLDISLIL